PPHVDSGDIPKAVESFSAPGMTSPRLLFSQNLVPVWIATASFCGRSTLESCAGYDYYPPGRRAAGHPPPPRPPGKGGRSQWLGLRAGRTGRAEPVGGRQVERPSFQL